MGWKWDFKHRRPDHEAPGYRYGTWAGDSRGHPQHSDRCVCEVPRGAMLFKQCRRARGHGFGGLYCAQHGKQYPATD